MLARRLVLTMVLGSCLSAAAAAGETKLSASAVNEAEPAGQEAAFTLRAQVLLDRAGFSPGVIDGARGDNTRRAIRAFRRVQGLPEGDQIDAETWDKLADQRRQPALVDYVITAADVKGPYVADIPEALEEQAKLQRLSYRTPLEALAERFHMDEALLKTLNPDADFAKAGTKIVVASVTRAPRREKIEKLVVSKDDASLRVVAESGRVIAFYPATVGSEEKPAPTGTLKIRTLAQNPFYTYNPAFKFAGVNAKERFRIAAGPNNPVGVAWIGLDKEGGYGIHGTPDPTKVGKAESHGCVRLTNWDALELVRMVTRGTVVEFEE